MIVAPLAGAWIEMDEHTELIHLRGVAPLAGAWIEISYICMFRNRNTVAPLAGAWIDFESLCTARVFPVPFFHFIAFFELVLYNINRR